MKFYPSGKLPKNPHMYFVYGDGGTGKTTIFKQFEGRKLLFSFDLSTDVIEPEDNTDVITFDAADAPKIQKLVWASLEKMIAKGVYQAIALDNVTALQNLVLENINASKDGRQNYQELQHWFRQLGTMLRESGVAIYATAHQITGGADDLSGNQYKPDMNDRTFNGFVSMFDFVGRIYIKGGQRIILADPEQERHVKNRVDSRLTIRAEELINPEKESEE